MLLAGGGLIRELGATFNYLLRDNMLCTPMN